MSISHNILPRARARYFGIALLVAFGCAISLQGAFAATQPDAARSTAVSYADLDLSSPAGIRTFYRRIQQAAREVCNASDPIMRLYLQVERASGGRSRSTARRQRQHAPFLVLRCHDCHDDCYRRTVADAVARMNSPMLTALHRVETGGPTGR